MTSGLILLLIFAIMGILIFSGSAKLNAESPARCEDVSEWDIEPPHNGTDCRQLRKDYLEAEETLTESHAPNLTESIQRSMAGCLMQGWPVDVAIAQSCYTFSKGVCTCPTCKSLVNARQ